MSDLDARTREALDAWRAHSLQEPSDQAVRSARHAMHRAVVVSPRRSGLFRLLADQGPRGLRLAVGGLALAAALSLVGVEGWNAPAGAPFHLVRVAREQVSLALAGSGAAQLRLSYAEARLQDAADGQGSRTSSLAEASSLLNAVRGELSSSSPLQERLEQDEAALRDEESDGGAPASPPSPGAAATAAPPASSPSEGETSGPEPSDGSGGQPEGEAPTQRAVSSGSQTGAGYAPGSGEDGRVQRTPASSWSPTQSAEPGETQVPGGASTPWPQSSPTPEPGGAPGG